MAWQTPVYDRTNDDVSAVVPQMKAWRGNHAAVSDLKGVLSPSDMNRIEGNMAYLQGALGALGFAVAYTAKTNWAYTDYSALTTAWRAQNIGRILAGLQNIASVLPNGYVTRPVPANMLHYDEINAIEYIQWLVNRFIADTTDSFRYSGGAVSGDIY